MRPSVDPLLAVYLWDLRGQLETQLRCLTKIHRWVEEYPSLDAESRAPMKDEVLENLRDIHRTADIVREAEKSAVDLAEKTL